MNIPFERYEIRDIGKHCVILFMDRDNNCREAPPLHSNRVGEFMKENKVTQRDLMDMAHLEDITYGLQRKEV